MQHDFGKALLTDTSARYDPEGMMGRRPMVQSTVPKSILKQSKHAKLRTNAHKSSYIGDVNLEGLGDNGDNSANLRVPVKSKPSPSSMQSPG